MKIRRKIFSDLVEHLSKPEITVILGPRQSGKTTIMKALEKKAREIGKKTVFFNLDIEDDMRFFSSQSDFLRKVKLEVGDEGVVFIDEVQRKENAGLFLKGLWDMGLRYKFVVSGSGSFELKEKISESLVGRKKVFELPTISFEEFVAFKTEYRYSISDFFRADEKRSFELLTEYLNFGGYPRVCLAETLDEKREIIRDIFTSYIDKDVRYFGVERWDVFSELIRYIAFFSGRPISFERLCSSLGISFQTLKSYLWLYEKTFVLRRVTPFFSSRTKEMVKAPLFYFYDIGLRNWAAGMFGMLRKPDDFSFPFQNLVFHIIRERYERLGGTIHFWRTKGGAELDFVVRLGGVMLGENELSFEGEIPKGEKQKRGKDIGQFVGELVPFEVKFSRLSRPTFSRSLRSFVEKYNPHTAYVINLSLSADEKLKNTALKFRTIYEIVEGKEEKCNQNWFR